MLFTGYDMKEGETEPNKWRVENSWGDGTGPGKDKGDPYALEDGKGFYLMSGPWFKEYMYQIAVKKSSLAEALKPLVDTEDVTVLPAWDPMGALARVPLAAE